jgi:hypothetical protein
MADSEEGRTDELDHGQRAGGPACTGGRASSGCCGRWGTTRGQLFAMAGLAGIVAAIAPSRRAARLDILRAVTTE